jgi:ribosomal protein S18 acetylase RimI-like enzyme
MLTEANINFREANLMEDCLIAEHFYQMWLDLNVSADDIKPDYIEITQKFIKNARSQLNYKAFVAESGNKVVASGSCQLFSGLYPPILKEDYRKYGYVWGVYVEPEYRQQGIAKKLTLLITNYLKSLGCTRVVLNASPQGQSIYSSLGFCESNAMHLDLI